MCALGEGMIFKMVNLVIAATILIFIMLIFVFILFKNIIKRIDDNAKKYFVNKMQDYDYILEEKQTKLEEIKQEIEDIKKINKNIVYKEGIIEKEEKKLIKHTSSEEDVFINKKDELKINTHFPEYRETQFFNNYKEIKNIFTINNEKTIKDFIKKHKNLQEEKEYKILKELRDEFTDEAIYECVTLEQKDQIKVLSEILSKKAKLILKYDDMIKTENFNVRTLIKILDDKLEELEPYIYVYVNGVSSNFDYIDKNIVTKQYKNMSEGIIIKFRNKIYDYSI